MRRLARLAALAIALLLPPSLGVAQDANPFKERVLGDPKAPIEVIEYASLTCHHCASFHAQVLPRLKKEFIETGKVRYFYRDFPLDPLAFAAAALAQCVPDEHYFAFLDTLYANQTKWSRDPNPLKVLTGYAALLGLGEEQVKACLGNRELIASMTKVRETGVNLHGVDATPTLVIDGAKYKGDAMSEQFITRLLRAVENKTN